MKYCFLHCFSSHYLCLQLASNHLLIAQHLYLDKIIKRQRCTDNNNTTRGLSPHYYHHCLMSVPISFHNHIMIDQFL